MVNNYVNKATKSKLISIKIQIKVTTGPSKPKKKQHTLKCLISFCRWAPREEEQKSKSVQSFLRERVTHIHPSIHPHELRYIYSSNKI